MPNILVPPNCQSITTSAQGLITPTNNICAVTSAVEATILTSPYSAAPGSTDVSSTPSVGFVNMTVPSVLTAININGTGYTVTGGQISNVPEADATAFIAGMRNVASMFQLVNG